jgi:DNA-binding NarL/FixJ family response regulator
MSAMAWSVLVVDDDASFRALATRTLRALGYAVVGEAATCEEAVERALALRPDAALVDVGLPDGDGFELAQRFAALSRPPRVVLISSDSDAANEAVARRMGAAGFVPKDELLGASLRDLIGGG